LTQIGGVQNKYENFFEGCCTTGLMDIHLWLGGSKKVKKGLMHDVLPSARPYSLGLFAVESELESFGKKKRFSTESFENPLELELEALPT
jgi:hypothetical protein